MISIDIEKYLNAYNGLQILKISHNFPSNSITRIYGPSGAGKTTFLKIIAGLIRPEKGSIVVDDMVWLDTEKNISLSPQNRKTGFVFQNYALFPNMTVRQHLEYATSDQHWIGRLLKIGQLEDLSQRRPDHLSGGQQQRLSILRAMAIKPKLVLMDEPFSALDTKLKASLITELKILWTEFGATAIVVSHNSQELEVFTDQEILIEGF